MKLKIDPKSPTNVVDEDGRWRAAFAEPSDAAWCVEAWNGRGAVPDIVGGPPFGGARCWNLRGCIDRIAKGAESAGDRNVLVEVRLGASDMWDATRREFSKYELKVKEIEHNPEWVRCAPDGGPLPPAPKPRVC